MPGGETVPLTDSFRKVISDQIEEMQQRPLRCLALAMKDGESLSKDLRNWDGSDGTMPSVLKDSSRYADVESQLTFLGICGIKVCDNPSSSFSLHRSRCATVIVFPIIALLLPPLTH